MTRLIDADELTTMCEKSLEYAERCLHAQTSDYGHFIVLSTIQTWKFMIEILEEEAPTVNAIPVNYIQDRIDSLQSLAEYEMEANGGYVGKVHTEVYALRALINYWKGEQSAKDK